MATISLTPAQQATRSTVALKALMAVTGLILIGYLLAHMYGNLKIFAGEEAFNDYAHHLRTLGEPILPYSGALWIIRVVLIVSVLAHMYAAFSLWGRAHKARGGTRRYYSNKSRTGVQRTYASFTLRWGGVVILLFVIYHLLHLTWNTIHPGGAAAEPRPCGERLPDLVGCPGVHDRDDCGRLPSAARHVERADNTRSQYLEPRATTPEHPGVRGGRGGHGWLPAPSLRHPVRVRELMGDCMRASRGERDQLRSA